MKISLSNVNTTGECVANSIVLFTKDKSGQEKISFEYTALHTGFHILSLGYYHYDWDQWVTLEINSTNGTIGYIPPLPHGKNRTEIPVMLYAGINSFSITHRFGHELYITDIEIKETFDVPDYSLTPSADCYYSDNPRLLHTVVESYGDPLISVSCGESEIPFTSHPISCPTAYNGLSFIKSDVFLDIRNSGLLPGSHTLRFCFKSGKILTEALNILSEYKKRPLKIISFDADHGNSTLMHLPNGKYLMIDSGYEAVCHKNILPYLKRNNIKIDYYLLTHFHSDHYGVLDEILKNAGIEKISPSEISGITSLSKEKRYRKLTECRYLDSNMLCRYDELNKIWDLGGVEITVMNSRYNTDGTANKVEYYADIAFNEHNYENATSVSFLLHYGKFGYYHGADTYAYTQEQNLKDFSKQNKEKELECDYYYANHHFHCDVSVKFLRAVNPKAVYVPTNFSAYSHSAFIHDFGKAFLKSGSPEIRCRDTLLTAEIGAVVVETDSNGASTLTEYYNSEDLI